MKTIQQILFERALDEEQIPKVDVNIHHGIPKNFNNKKEYNFVFPKSFLNDIKTLNYDKTTDYIFIGTISGEHRQFLHKWDKPNSIVKTTLENKFVHPNDKNSGYPENKFNKGYFQDLASTKFTLCPGGCTYNEPKHLSNNYLKWTYRFWEACLSKSIPITNEPDERWHQDYKYYSLEDEHIYREDWVEHNFNLVKERHFIW